MSKYSSYKDINLEKQVKNIERELVALKSKQPYSPSLMNYGYKSNVISIDSYNVVQQYEVYDGVCASLIFTSTLPNTYPRVSLFREEFLRSNGNPWGAVLLYLRYEPLSKNSCRIVFQTTCTMVPFSENRPYTQKASVYSNVSGVLSLENTYVISDEYNPGY